MSTQNKKTLLRGLTIIAAVSFAAIVVGVGLLIVGTVASFPPALFFGVIGICASSAYGGQVLNKELIKEDEHSQIAEQLTSIEKERRDQKKDKENDKSRGKGGGFDRRKAEKATEVKPKELMEALNGGSKNRRANTQKKNDSNVIEFTELPSKKKQNRNIHLNIPFFRSGKKHDKAAVLTSNNKRASKHMHK